MKAQEFGTRLRELRKHSGLTLRGLADMVNIDFTYLSKIESGAMPPPSIKVISQLAEALNTDKDGLVILAGKIPSDIVQILKDEDTLKSLRAGRAKQVAVPPENEGESVDVIERSVSYKSLSKVVVAIVLVLAVAAAFWFAAPVVDSAYTYNNRGFTYNDEGEYQKALVALNKAIELDPGFAIAYSNRGWSYIGLEQYEQAVADCTEAIELDPNLGLAYSNRAWAYIELGQYEEAITDYDRAIELDPNLLTREVH